MWSFQYHRWLPLVFDWCYDSLSYRYYWFHVWSWVANNGNHTEHIEAETTCPPFCRQPFPTHVLEWNIWISIAILLKLVPKCPINNIPALVEIIAWRRPGDKLLSGPVMVSLLTHICVARPRWVESVSTYFFFSNVTWGARSRNLGYD